MWWFAAVHANLLVLYRQIIGHRSPAKPLLDAGCGTGALLAKIGTAYPTGCAIGLDANTEACLRAAAKSARPVCSGSVNELPFADRAFAAIFSADVLCHRDVDESAALVQFQRCLSDEGVLVLNLPAYGWMLSEHDAAVYNVRRYTRHRLAGLLARAGFRVLYLSYWNAILFPLMVITRKLLPRLGAPTSDVMLYPRPIEVFCRAVTNFELALLRRGARLPFGGSLIAVAAKAESLNA